MSKTIDFRKSVYDLCKDSPDIQRVMKDLGFESITKPGMIQTAGKFMTIPKGASMKKIPMDQVREAFIRQGYKIIE